MTAALATVFADVRFALRGLAKHRAFAATAVLSLALGIGVNTGIFTVLRALLLEPLPYKDADRLVILWNRSPGLNIAEDWFSTAQYFDIKQGSSAFDEVAIAIGANYNLAGDGANPERIGCIRISSNLLPMLGAGVAAGRLFDPEDDVPGRSGTAILSYGTWTRRYGRDPSVIGRTIRLNDQPYQIIGVLGPAFQPAARSDADARRRRVGRDFSAAAALRGGPDDADGGGLQHSGEAAARRERAGGAGDLDVITARLRADLPTSTRRTAG